MTMTLRDLRISYGITQKEASDSVNVPLRTYVRYENSNDETNLKYQKILDLLKEKYEITETKGVLSIESIKTIVAEVFKEYKDSINYCYLFGSYAKGYAKDGSDVDLCVDTKLTGLSFIGLIERLRQSLKKEVDLLRVQDITNNLELLNEIMKDGIKIYG